MGVGVNKLLTRLAERLTTLVLMSLVPEQIDVLFAVLTLEMVFADLPAHMLLITVFATERTATICAKVSSVRHTFLVAAVTLRKHADTIMPFLVLVGFLAHRAIVAATRYPDMVVIKS